MTKLIIKNRFKPVKRIFLNNINKVKYGNALNLKLR
jgi:hypothetical protein